MGRGMAATLLKRPWVHRLAAIGLLLYVLVPSLCALTCGFSGRCTKAVAAKSCCGGKTEKGRTNCCEWIEKRVDPPAVFTSSLDAGPNLFIAVWPVAYILLGIVPEPHTVIAQETGRGPPGRPILSRSTRAPPTV